MDIRTARGIAKRHGLRLDYYRDSIWGAYTLSADRNPRTLSLWSNPVSDCADYTKAELRNFTLGHFEFVCRDFAAECVDFTAEQTQRYEERAARMATK